MRPRSPNKKGRPYSKMLEKQAVFGETTIQALTSLNTKKPTTPQIKLRKKR